MKQAWLTGISRCFGGDNAFYNGMEFPAEIINVSVGWGLLASCETLVFINDKCVRKFEGDRHIQPQEALSLMGYEVHGTVDFAACVAPNETNP